MLYETALIVIPNVTATTMKVTDKMASEELTERKGAVKKSARVVKALIDPAQLKPILAVQGAFRTYLQSVTVPWLGDTALLPKARYYEFKDKVTAFQDQLDKEVAYFIKKYSSMIQKAHEDLGSLFDSNAYPDVFELQSKFSISVRYMPVPDVNQFSQLGLESESADFLRAEALKAENDMMAEATENLFRRVHHRVQLLHNRLTDENTKRYRESLVEGLQFLVDVMPSLNLMKDPLLISLMDDIEKMVASFTFDQIRESDRLRGDVAAECDAILKRMQGMF